MYSSSNAAAQDLEERVQTSKIEIYYYTIHGSCYNKSLIKKEDEH